MSTTVCVGVGEMTGFPYVLSVFPMGLPPCALSEAGDSIETALKEWWNTPEGLTEHLDKKELTAMNQPTENWLPIPGWEGLYEVSDLGRVRSLDRLSPVRGGSLALRKGRVRSLGTDRYGRRCIPLSRNGVQTMKQVHRLVLEAFVGPCPAGQEACHWDGDPTNNKLENLRWDSHTANEADKLRIGPHYETLRAECRRGHPLAEPNLVTSALAKGKRSCLACARALAHAHRRGIPVGQDLADEYFAAISAT
ncbi:NUMOD4 motif-containing HNH endonuclease [Microbacterium sp. NPDC058269]|uniref:NUMOD4 motif-containing HNH endonuclease n=1 Tax=Microbacterium sp. NPDC058269 TaxID=3346414 RepID=UPI0036DDF4C2